MIQQQCGECGQPLDDGSLCDGCASAVTLERDLAQSELKAARAEIERLRGVCGCANEREGTCRGHKAESAVRKGDTP